MCAGPCGRNYSNHLGNEGGRAEAGGAVGVWSRVRRAFLGGRRGVGVEFAVVSVSDEG